MPKEFDPLSMFRDEQDIEDVIVPPKKDDAMPPKKEDNAPPPPKKGKEDSIADLRKAKEVIQKEKEDLERELADLRGLKPLKKVADYLKTKTKKDSLEEGDVDEYITRNKTRKQKTDELEKSLKTKDQALKEISIEHSDEWKTEYVKPIQKAAANIFTIIANQHEDKDGKIVTREEALTKGLMNQLVSLDKDGNPKQPLEIKGIISKFRKAYEEKTGLEYEMPSLKEIVEAVETVHINIARADKAKANWNEELESKNKERIFEEAQKEKTFIKKELEGRDYLVSKLKGSQDIKDLKEIIGDEDEVAAAFDEEHEFLKKGVRKDSDYKPRGYDALVKSLGKAKLFDKLVEKFKALQSENEELKTQRNSGLPPAKGKKPGENERNRDQPKEVTKDNILDMFKVGEG
jgi:hypothetical protein